MRDAYGLIKPMFRSSKPDPALSQRGAYIPPHIESAMTNHVQESMPAHLKKYRGGNTYIPEHAQAEMTQHLESALPQHMKQYAGAYMQQNVIQPSLDRRGSAAPPAPPPESSVTPHAPGVPTGLQNTVQTSTVTPSAPPSAAPAATPTANQAASPDQAYAFITNPVQSPKKSGIASILSSSSLPLRIALVTGGLLVLLVLFVIIRGLFTSSPAVDSFIPIVQEQQAIILLVSDAEKEGGQNLSAGNKNVMATVNVSLTSSQTATIKYLNTNNKKLKPEQLNLKVSTATNKQLADAATSGTYNQVFHDILESKLAAYGNALNQAYKQNPGPKGKALLTDSYKQLQLMQTQLKATPAN